MEILDFRVRPQTDYFYRNIYPNTIPAYAPYIRLFDMSEEDGRLIKKPIEQSIDEMARQGITKGVIFAGEAEGNKEVFKVCSQYPDTYIGLAGINITQGVSKGVEDLEQALDEYGLKGLSLGPFATGIPATDPRYYPLYSLLERKGKVLQCHSAIHYNPDVSLDVADPQHLDRIAVDFPNLKIVMSHAGFGFGDVGTTVAIRHPNMYIDLSGLHPKYLPERLIGLSNTLLKKKVIFGTNYPCLNFEIVHAWKRVIREDNQPFFFAKNAKRVLCID